MDGEVHQPSPPYPASELSLKQKELEEREKQGLYPWHLAVLLVPLTTGTLKHRALHFLLVKRIQVHADSEPRTGVSKHHCHRQAGKVKALKEGQVATREDTGKNHKLIPISVSENIESTP